MKLRLRNVAIPWLERIPVAAGLLVLCLVLVFPPHRLRSVRPYDCADHEAVFDRNRLVWIPIWEPNIRRILPPVASKPRPANPTELCATDAFCLTLLWETEVLGLGGMLAQIELQTRPGRARQPLPVFNGDPAEARQALAQHFPTVATALDEYEARKREEEAQRSWGPTPRACEELRYELDAPRLVLAVTACAAATLGLFVAFRPRRQRP